MEPSAWFPQVWELWQDGMDRNAYFHAQQLINTVYSFAITHLSHTFLKSLVCVEIHIICTQTYLPVAFVTSLSLGRVFTLSQTREEQGARQAGPREGERTSELHNPWKGSRDWWEPGAGSPQGKSVQQSWDLGRCLQRELRAQCRGSSGDC